MSVCPVSLFIAHIAYKEAQILRSDLLLRASDAWESVACSLILQGYHFLPEASFFFKCKLADGAKDKMFWLEFWKQNSAHFPTLTSNLYFLFLELESAHLEFDASKFFTLFSNGDDLLRRAQHVYSLAEQRLELISSSRVRFDAMG